MTNTPKTLLIIIALLVIACAPKPAPKVAEGVNHTRALPSPARKPHKVLERHVQPKETSTGAQETPQGAANAPVKAAQKEAAPKKAAPKKAAPAKPDCSSAAGPFDVHGEGTKGGVTRHFRIGAPFSVAGGEGGKVALSVVGIERETLIVARNKTPFGGKKTTSERQRYGRAVGGGFTLRHSGATVQFEDKTVQQQGHYRVNALSKDCFEVRLLADIPAYQGE